MNASRERRHLVDVCRQAALTGFMTASDGNASLRLDGDRFLITPSGPLKASLKPEDLLEVDGQGRTLAGQGRPSSELGMHLAAYALRSEVGAVFHAHPPAVTAFAVAGHPLPLEALPEALFSLGRVPSLPYHTPGSDQLVEEVRAHLDGHDALVLTQHGLLTLGPDIDTAWARAQKLEHAARTLLHAQALGGARTLPPEEQERLIAWGQRVRREEVQRQAGPARAALPPLAERIERLSLPLTPGFAVEKRHADARGQAHLIINDRPLCRVCLLTLNVGAGYRGGHYHRHKHEGFYITQGLAHCELACVTTGERLAFEAGEGERLWLPPGIAHRFTALAPLTFVEFTDRPYDPEDDLPFAF